MQLSQWNPKRPACSEAGLKQPQGELKPRPACFQDLKELTLAGAAVKRDPALIAEVEDHGANQHQSTSPDLSIIIPAYNEAGRLPPTLEEITDYIMRRRLRAEIIVVDDGSTDETAKVVQEYACRLKSPPLRLLRNHGNKGKGFSVRQGVLNSTGRRILFTDADGSTPITEITRLEEKLNRGSHIAVGSRALYSHDTEVLALWHRKLLGRIYARLVNCLLLPGISDTQCGFKLFEASAAKLLFSVQRADRFSFDVEVLFLAQKYGYSVNEVPVNWKNVPGSKVNLVRDSVSMLLDLLRFRFRYFRGLYSRPPPSA